MRRINELWAFIVTDAEGEEGLLQIVTEIGDRPAIGDSRQSLEALRPYAEEAAADAPVALTVARFVRFEET
jgi:hypothetical protein